MNILGVVSKFRSLIEENITKNYEKKLILGAQNDENGVQAHWISTKFKRE